MQIGCCQTAADSTDLIDFCWFEAGHEQDWTVINAPSIVVPTCEMTSRQNDLFFLLAPVLLYSLFVVISQWKLLPAAPVRFNITLMAQVFSSMRLFVELQVMLLGSQLINLMAAGLSVCPCVEWGWSPQNQVNLCCWIHEQKDLN